jgi:hypothetical protein
LHKGKIHHWFVISKKQYILLDKWYNDRIVFYPEDEKFFTTQKGASQRHIYSATCANIKPEIGVAKAQPNEEIKKNDQYILLPEQFLIWILKQDTNWQRRQKSMIRPGLHFWILWFIYVLACQAVASSTGARRGCGLRCCMRTLWICILYSMAMDEYG